MAQDPLIPQHQEVDWGPSNRVGIGWLDTLRARVGEATLRGIVPIVAITLGALILAIGGVLVWTSLTAPDASGKPPIASAQAPPSYAAESDLLPGDIEHSADRDLGVEAAMVIVHVSGHVHAPGIVEIPATARVFHAIEAAQGALDAADLDRINLAALVVDGSQIYVPSHDETSEPDPGSARPSVIEPTTAPDVEPVAEASSPVDTRSDVAATPSVDQPTSSAAANVASETSPEQPAERSPAPAAGEPSQPPEGSAAPAPNHDPESNDTPGTATEIDEHAIFDRATAPTPEEMQAWLSAEGVGMPPELEAELFALDAPPTPEELQALFEKYGLTDDAP